MCVNGRQRGGIRAAGPGLANMPALPPPQIVHGDGEKVAETWARVMGS